MKKIIIILLTALVLIVNAEDPPCSQGNQKAQTIKGKTTTDDTPASSGIMAILHSEDPNEIVGTDGWIVIAEGDTTRWVGASQSMPFTIYFENDPEQATAAAQVVTIRMRLDPLMNMADFGIGTFGFGNHVFPVEGAPLQYQTRLDLTTEMNLYVDVVAGIDITTNEAFWIFSSIDPITGVAPTETDRGFLAVNDSTHIGEGYVTFSIKPKADLCHTGDTISAQASIVFDINDPIETNRWVNTIDAGLPVSSCTVIDDTLLRPSDTSPNLGEELDSLRIVFSGTDDTTGIAAYRLYYTEGRSAFRLAGRYLPDDTAVLEKNPNAQYTFFSIAEDNVGNMEPMKDSPDTLFGNTRVSLLASVTPAGAATITGAGSYTQGDTATLALHPATGYRLTRWVEAGVPQGTDTLLSIVADGNHSIIAEMERLSYSLTVESAEGTTIEVTSAGKPVFQTIQHFDTLNIHLTASPCYSNVAFTLNGQPLSNDTTVVVTGAINLTSSATTHIDTGFVYDTVCPGTAYTANGFNILSTATQNSGTFTFHLSPFTSSGCDSVAHLSLYVKPSHTITFIANGGNGSMPAQRICDGEAAVLNRGTYSREGYYFAGWGLSATDNTALYADGDIIHADNNITLYAVWSSSCVDRVANRIVTACDSYSWKDSTYTASGQYTRTLTAVVPGGCDSIYQLHLTLKHSTNNIQQVYACRQYTWMDGISYTTDTTRQLSLTNAQGCDSLITLQLSLGDDVTATEQVSVCDSLHWIDGNTYHQSVSGPFATIPSMYGCDSTVTLQLTVNYSNTGIEAMTACDSFAWHETTYAASTNTPTFTTPNMAGCDSVTTLHLTVNYSNAAVETITACDSNVWHGTTYTASTNTPTYTTTNIVGCDSVTTLHLTVNYSNTAVETITACDSNIWHETTYTASTSTPTFTTTNMAGCDSVTTLHLTVNYSNAAVETITACDSNVWHETTYTASTSTPTFTSTNMSGCDSVTTLHLTVNYSNAAVETITACDSNVWHETTYTASTSTPTFTTTNMAGCDSVTTLHLTVNYSNSVVETITACDSNVWHETTYTASTSTPTYTTTNMAGCDSVTTLHLTVNYSNAAVETITACDSNIWHETTYTASTNTPTYTTTNVAGCDSVTTLHLTVNYSNSAIETVTACDSNTWHGTTYNASTSSPTYTTTNMVGCDSVTTLHLTINYSTAAIEAISACNSYVWHGTEYTSSTNTPTFTTSNAVGCDSVTTLNLTIIPCSTTEITTCDSFMWHGTTYTASGLYTDGTDTLILTINYSNTGIETITACDSNIWHGATYTVSTNTPTYTTTNVVGCDSVTTLHLTVNYSSSAIETIIACDSSTWHGTTYTASTNTPTYMTTNMVGCDSVTTLHLTVNNSSTSNISAIACDTFSWYEHTNMTTSQNVTHYMAGANQYGCDSTIVLNLTVNYSTIGDTTAIVCDSYNWYEHTNMTVSQNVTHLFVGDNHTGCDSTVTLHLTINNSTSANENITACDSYIWHGTEYTSSTNTPTYTTINAAGCDSVTTLHLTINYSTTGMETVTACNSYMWHGTEYTSSTNTATYTTVNAAGCDSVTTLHLTIIECNTTLMTACDSYSWHDNTFTVSGTYIDGTDTLILTVHYSTSGDTTAIAYSPFDWYEHLGLASSQEVTHTFVAANQYGCDSTVTLHFRYPLYNAVWTGDTFVTYNAQPYCGLSASYVDDNNTTMGTVLVYSNGTETITSPNCPMNAGTYTVTARPMNPIDSLLGATTTLTILPATVSVSGVEAETAKFYDGAVDATVINRGTLDGVQGNDNLTHTTTAWFSQAEVGTNLTVTIGYTIEGDMASNYILDPVESIYSTDGAILATFETDSTIVTGDTLDGSQDGILVDADGYCAGTGMIGFRLASGNPDQYKLVFSNTAFTNVDWTFLEGDGIIYFDVPENVATGDYDVTIYFRHHDYPSLVSNPVTVPFHINLPEMYIVPLFNDVIALIDTCHCITDIQWYRRASGESVWTLIPGANGLFCYQEGGLEGWEFTVRCKYDGQETFTCPQTDMHTLVSDEPSTLTAYPNPTTGEVTIRIDNATTVYHTLVLLNMMGVQMEQRTFNGNTVNLDLSGYQRGSYMVSVDGMVVRIIRN